MRRFTSAAHAQWFLSVHGLVLNLFRVGRHLLGWSAQPPLASDAGVRRMGCGDGCLLNDEGYRAIEGSSRPPLINLTVPQHPLTGLSSEYVDSDPREGPGGAHRGVVSFLGSAERP